LEFECRVPVDGYRVLYFDEGKFVDLAEYDEDGSVPEPANATEDELYLLRRWGARILPPPKFAREAMSQAASRVYGSDTFWEPQVRAFFEPLSEDVRSFNLFEEVSSPYIDFVNLDLGTATRGALARGNVEEAKTLADRYGPLFEGPQPAFEWVVAAMSLRVALKAWKHADRTKNFRPFIRRFSEKGLFKFVGRSRIDASITIREDPESGTARLCIRPETLLDALWTQVAHAIDGSQSLQNCVVCKKWFTIKAGQGRSDKEYCSNACRMRAYRKRKGKRLT
jgi:hypothetical protein